MASGPKKPNKAFNNKSAARAQIGAKGTNVCACGKECGRFTKCFECFEKESSPDHVALVQVILKVGVPTREPR